MAHKFWHDDAGFVISIELILITTIVVIGLIVGLTAVRDAVVSELSDVGGAVSELVQSYSFNGVSSATAFSAGSDYRDSTDSNDEPDDSPGEADNCIVFSDPPIDESS